MLKKYAWMYVCEKSTNLELQFELVFHALVVVPTCPFPKRPSRIRFDRKPIIIIGFIVLYVLDKRLIFGLQTFRPLGRSRTCLSKNNSSKRNKSSFQFLVQCCCTYQLSKTEEVFSEALLLSWNRFHFLSFLT